MKTRKATAPVYADGQIIRPRLERGVDYGRPRAVLVRQGNKELHYRPGYMMWGGRGQPQRYEPAALSLRNLTATRFEGVGVPVFEGRLTKARLREHAEIILGFFGWPALDLDDVRRDRTLILE